MWRALRGGVEIMMRAAGNSAPSHEPWMGSARRGGTMDAIVPLVDGKSGGDLEIGNQESDGRTTPFERIEVALLESLGDESETGIEAAAPLPEAPGSQSISSAVLRLTRIAKYELTGKIGRGSFGVVYTARDTELEREVALKILNPSHHGDQDALHRFLVEGRAAARIAHPGIVTVHDCGRHTPEDGDELAYIAMERLLGESLTQRLDRVGCLRPAVAAEVARQVASALDAAHRADVLHRDLKPDNVFLVPDPAAPSGERVKVIDFGLAKIGSSRHTQTGSVFGTPLYMSPEQCRSSGRIDARSDIYALGCILFELLAGHPPFEGAIYEVLEQHLYAEPRRVSSLVQGIPPALDALVAAMLAKHPDDRPQAMADVARELEAVIAAASAPIELAEADRAAIEVLALPTSGKAQARRRRRPRRPRHPRHPLALIAAITIAIALASALSLMAVHRRGGGAEARPAVPTMIEKASPRAAT